MNKPHCTCLMYEPGCVTDQCDNCKREATRSVKEDCSRGYQRCHECEEFDCVDNMANTETNP